MIALGVTGLRASPGVAVAMCVLPFVSLYKPIIHFGEIWRATSPPDAIERAGGRWTAVAIAPIIVCWWLSYLVYGVVSTLIGMEQSNTPADPTAYAVMGVLSLISGALMTVVALRLSDREEKRHAAVVASLQN